MKIIEFYNEACGACKLLKSVLDKISVDKNIEIVYIDVDEHPECVKQYQIGSLPHVRFMEGINTIQTFTGYRPYKMIEDMINKIKQKEK